MDRPPIDDLCRKLGIRGDLRKLLILLCDRSDASVEEIVEYFYKDDPEGGPLSADSYIRKLISKLNRKLEGHASIKRRSGYSLQPTRVLKRRSDDR